MGPALPATLQTAFNVQLTIHITVQHVQPIIKHQMEVVCLAALVLQHVLNVHQNSVPHALVGMLYRQAIVLIVFNVQLSIVSPAPLKI